MRKIQQYIFNQCFSLSFSDENDTIQSSIIRTSISHPKSHENRWIIWILKWEWNCLSQLMAKVLVMIITRKTIKRWNEIQSEIEKKAPIYIDICIDIYIYIYIYGCYGVFHRWFPTATQWEELVELPCDGRWIRLYGRVLRRINSVSTEEVEDRIRRRRVTRWWNERPPSITGRAERVVREGERTWWWLYQECLMLSFGTHDRLSHPASRPGIKSWLAIIRS